jgi:N-acetylglucosaminyldiphosphoundecaprenol N-acetyl-beta-D-mannosaminyltransferase
MSQDTIIVLGIPIDNLSMDEAISSIFSMVDDYAADGRARQVATVNVDFVVNTLSWRLKNIRHPELLDILRRADLVTADGMPLVWISRLLGISLKERVTGADLVPRLAEEAAKRQKSLFLLGGRGDVAEQAADKLKGRYPDLKIAGVYSPFVHVEGEAIAVAEEEDERIVEKVNRSGADILLLAFGNPKQEVWFDRNRDRLKVPVSIGIGGTYEFIVGTVSRAPEWMRKSGLEWIFRITQDPKRLVKRYFVGFFKFGIMVWPAIMYYRYRRFRYRLSHRNDPSQDDRRIGETATRKGNITEIAFPERLDAPFLERSREKLEEQLRSATGVVLDFNQTRFIDSSGLGYIAKIWNRYATDRKAVHLVGVGPELVHFFKLNRLWDLFSKGVFEDVEEVLQQLEEKSAVGPSNFVIEHRTGYVAVTLFGRLDAPEIQRIDTDSILTAIGGNNCILDLDGLDFIDSSGIGFLIKIQKHVSKHGRGCILCKLPDNVRQMLSITKVMPLFQIAKNIAAAEKGLKKFG